MSLPRSTPSRSRRAQQRKFPSSNGTRERSPDNGPCQGRCRVLWSEKHVKEGLVLVQEEQLSRVVKTEPISIRYEIDAEPFASGQWARVYRCRSRSTGTLYAAKYSSRTRFNTDCSAELRHEIALLSLCSQSPRVVRLHDVYETTTEIILVMEFAPGGDLQSLIDGDLVPLEGDVVHYVKQLVEGLVYLHERNIAHLDIKPQNLVMMSSFPESQVKLCDFEISRVILEGSQVREILGTPDYVAPEILHYEPITLAADMWSLGVTTYVLLTGFSPFGGETDQETFENISLGEVDFPEELFEDISSQARDFVAKLLVLDPSARMSAKQCLQHEWLRDAPTQASPHLRRYLSKSREVLLERFVSRENLRRAALLSQATSHANLTEASAIASGNLSQSEMCLSYGSGDGAAARLTSSRVSLADSIGSSNGGYRECSTNPNDSHTSLNSSRTSLSTGITCLLDKEQTQDLLTRRRTQSGSSRAIFTHRPNVRPGIASKMPAFNQIQGCLSTASVQATLRRNDHATNSFFGIGRSREKLYGLRCLSKSHGGLDIYRSLECLRYDGNRSAVVGRKAREDNDDDRDDDDEDDDGGDRNDGAEDKVNVDGEINTTSHSSEIRQESMAKTVLESCNGEKLHSLESVESDTLTEDSDEQRSSLTIEVEAAKAKSQNSEISSNCFNDCNDDEDDDDEPKYTVSQLVSAFNKHQEVASKMSLETAIMTEKRVNQVQRFPTGPKALRLFIPDIDIGREPRNNVRERKTSRDVQKSWQDIRKPNEKSDTDLERPHGAIDGNISHNDSREVNTKKLYPSKDRPDSGQSLDGRHTIVIEKDIPPGNTTQSSYRNKERSPCTIVDATSITNEKEATSSSSSPKRAECSSPSEQRTENCVNLRDILKKTDPARLASKENLEKLRRHTSIAKTILNDKMTTVAVEETLAPSTAALGTNDGNNNTVNGSSTNDSTIDESRASFVTSVWENTGETPSSSVQIRNQHFDLEKKEKSSFALPVTDKRLWGRVCTGSYTRAMEKFNGKQEEQPLRRQSRQHRHTEKTQYGDA